jgi:hypothetical protein
MTKRLELLIKRRLALEGLLTFYPTRGTTFRRQLEYQITLVEREIIGALGEPQSWLTKFKK